MSTSFKVSHLLHVSVIVSDTQRALDFYCGLLGMEVNPNRALSFPGAWLLMGAQEFHVMELPNPDPIEGRPEHGGRDRHVAFAIDNILALEMCLKRERIKYTRSQSGRNAIFFRDPDGNALEFIEQPSQVQVEIQ